jgi:hypothetical protein
MVFHDMSGFCGGTSTRCPRHGQMRSTAMVRMSVMVAADYDTHLWMELHTPDWTVNSLDSLDRFLLVGFVATS